MSVVKWSLLFALAVVFTSDFAWGEVKRKKFQSGQSYLVIEILDDDLVHCEMSAVGSAPDLANPLYTSPMVFKTNYPGPSSFSESGNVLETPSLRIEVDPSNLCTKFIDKANGNDYLTSVCPKDLGNPEKALSIDPASTRQVYGLGQQFKTPGSSDGDWTTHLLRDGIGTLGNGFVGFQGGAVGNVQIPVMYAVAEDANYALFFDNVYRQAWDFQKFWWEVHTFGDQLRFYVLAGPDLPDLRKDYMELTGRPPVPPRKSFGMWVSEFGYDNFSQIDDLKNGLRAEKFPLDGFVLDLNWFGGINLSDPSKGHMGRLDWDVDSGDGNGYFFPNPKTQTENYAKDHLGLTVIEESYVANNTTTFSDLATELSSYARDGNGKCDVNDQDTPVTDVAGFWGKGKMIDWSDPKAGKFIHNQRRLPKIIKQGVTSHWTDLGEPETFNGNACYEGVETTSSGRKSEHADIHNLYNLLWNKSIWDGYFENRSNPSALGMISPRPFIVTRSGAAGTQRFGAAMWSGDIASNLESLATHANAQMHISFSGIDFYGADIGGFRREALPYNDKQGSYRGYENEMYTQWFANGCWFDVPVRPHTDNEFVQVNPPYKTAPHLVGHRESNLVNLRQRYELIPYYYSLAYRAHLFGEPLVPPLVYYHQHDPQVFRIGHEKLIGRDLVVGIVARHGEYERNIYLPAGRWVNYHSQEWIQSNGESIKHVPTYRDGLFRLPVFARAGAILPQMHVDEKSKDAFGNRTVGDKANESLIVRVFAGDDPSAFTLYEDDGKTLKYHIDGSPHYHHRTTEIKQHQVDDQTAKVRIEKAVDANGSGAFEGAVSQRHNIVRLAVNGLQATGVQLDGMSLPTIADEAAFQTADRGWLNQSRNVIWAKSPKLDVYDSAKEFTFALQSIPPVCSVNFVCSNGVTTPGNSIYVVGSIPALGSWDTSKAIKLSPSIYYDYIFNPPARHFGPGPSTPTWTGVISQLPPNATFEWKCIRKREDGTGPAEFEQGPNHVFTTGNSGFSGHAVGSF